MKREIIKYSLLMLGIYATHVFLTYVHSSFSSARVIPPAAFELKFVSFVSSVPDGAILPWQLIYYVGFPLFLIVGSFLVIYKGKGRALTLAYGLAVASAWIFYWIAVLYEPTYIGAAPKKLVMPPFVKDYEVTNFTSSPALCFPSLHVATSVIVGLFLVNMGFKKLGTINPLLISLSALFTAQHWLRDVIAGIILAIGCFLVADKIDTKLRNF